MAYASWAPLWSGIVESSLWDEPDYIIKVFITMMALKDADHVYRGNVYNLSKRTGKTQEEVLNAIKVLSAPDTRRQDHQDFEGRRVEAVEEGWLILNGEKYRQKVSREMKLARDRKSQAAYRERNKHATPTPSQPLPGERRFSEALKRGDEAEADCIAAEGLPPPHEREMPVSEQPGANHPEVPELE